jgi:hypothetical protein
MIFFGFLIAWSSQTQYFVDVQDEEVMGHKCRLDRNVPEIPSEFLARYNTV